VNRTPFRFLRFRFSKMALIIHPFRGSLTLGFDAGLEGLLHPPAHTRR
jgi:hypothetical protein